MATIKKIFLKNVNKIVPMTSENTLTSMGSIISNGIINAAGRNASISLTTRDGNVRMNAVTGMVLFLQHWYWYPMLNFVTLALTPTSLIAVNKDLKVPKSFESKLNAKPSLFKYPDFLKKEEDTKKGKVETAVLSTTAKVKARVERKKGTKGDVEMADSQSATPSKAAADDKEKSAAADDKEKSATDKADGAAEEEKKEDDKGEEEKKDEPEPDFGMCKNPCRMLKQQEQKMEYLMDPKYKYFPVLKDRFSGFVVLKEVEGGGDGEPEKFYDDEERDLDAPNPDLVSDLDIPKPFEFDPADRKSVV